MKYEALMAAAISEAKLAEFDVPVGALVVSSSGQILAIAHNQKELSGDPSAHAEVLALRKAAEVQGDWRLDGHTLVVTLEPCVMCAGVILATRLKGLVFGAYDQRAGAAGSVYDVVRDPRLGGSAWVVGGVLEDECQKLLGGFFRSRRTKGQAPESRIWYDGLG